MTRLTIILVILVGTFGAGWWVGRSDNAARVAWLEDEVDRQRTLAKQASRDQQIRNQQIMGLTKQVAAYETELENGTVSGCAADPAYSRRLRAILQTAD